MRAPKVFSQSEGTLIADYASRLGESFIRQRAELEVRAARAEAELAIRARSEFLANMNHELRTPLNAIIGFATMLRDIDNFQLSEEQKHSYAEYILQSADLLLGHINTLLDVAALESGAVGVSDAAVDCSDALMNSIERMNIQADAAGVAIERRDDGKDVFAWGDSERIGQALDHVLQTAIKSCETGDRVFARACVDKNCWAEIAVRDNGDGYDADELTEALEAFQQVHRGLDRSFSGPGVGYAVAKTFIEMQGGRFAVKSKKGQGTLVRIILPPPDKLAEDYPVHSDQCSSNDKSITMESAHDAA